MLRRLFIIASAVSLLLCFASAALWVRSYRHGHFVERHQCVSADPASAVHHRQSIQIAGGQLRFVNSEQTVYQGTLRDRILHPDPSAQWSIDPHFLTFSPIPSSSFMNHLGFGHWTDSGSMSWHTWQSEIWSMPLWVLALCFGIPPMVEFAKLWRRRRLSREGRCPHCGYDLRASTERCPECGMPIPVKMKG